MTLQELLRNHPFDAIAPYIDRVEEGQAIMMPKYKEVYDILRNIEGEKCDEEITVKWTGGGESEPYSITDNYIFVENCEGGKWEDNVSKQVVVDEGVHISEEELCARLLWSCTFYGFSQGEKDFVRCIGGYIPATQYGIRAMKFEEQLILRNLSKKYHLEYKRSMLDDDMKYWGGALSSEGWRDYSSHTSRCNRSKRKRNYRMEQQAELLKRKDKIEGLIQRFLKTDVVTPFTPTHEALNFLFGNVEKLEKTYHSHTYGECSPTDYILELIEKYETVKFKNIGRFMVRLATSDKSRLIASGKMLPFIERIKKWLPQDSTIDWYHCYDNTLGNEIQLTILCCAEQKIRRTY